MQLLPSQKKKTAKKGKIQGKDAAAQPRRVLGKDARRGSPAALWVKPRCCGQQRAVPTHWVKHPGGEQAQSLLTKSEESLI